MSPGAASGIPAKGASTHGPGCTCVRCRGFQPGHHYADGHGRPTTHGAKSRPHILAKAPRTLELADAIREVVPIYDPADEFTVHALSVVLVRVERATAALEQLDADLDERGEGPLASYAGEGEKFDSLRKDLRSWISVAERYFAALGMSPGSRARLGLDIARARRLTVVDWHRLAAIEEAEG
jgi:hypothetical protein